MRRSSRFSKMRRLGIALSMILGTVCGMPHLKPSRTMLLQRSQDLLKQYGMEWEEFTSILSSEVSQEEWQSASEEAWIAILNDSVTEHWKEDVAFEQGLIKEQIDNRMPFVACSYRVDLSGHDRWHKHICPIILPQVSGMDAQFIYNHANKTCVYLFTDPTPLLRELRISGQLQHDLEQRTHDCYSKELTVHPLLAKAKLVAGTMRLLTPEISIPAPMLRIMQQNVEPIKLPELAITLCDANNDSETLWMKRFSDGFAKTNQDCQQWTNNNVYLESFIPHKTKYLFLKYHKNELASENCLQQLLKIVTESNHVCQVEVVSVMHPQNIQAQWLVQSGIEDHRTWFDEGLTGKGQLVALSDTGVDLDNCYFWDSTQEFKKDGTFDPRQRKISEYTFAPSSVPDLLHGHGTHVAGTICGHKSVDGNMESSNSLANGVAPDAKLAVYNAGDESK